MLEPVSAPSAGIRECRLLHRDVVVVELDRGDRRIAPVSGVLLVILNVLVLVLVVDVLVEVLVLLEVLVLVEVLVVILVLVVVLAGLVRGLELADLLLVLLLDLVGLAVPVAVLVVLVERAALEVADQRGELARERVDLVAAQRRAGGQLRLGVVQDAVEPEDERVVAPPLVARLGQAALHLGQGGVEGGAADRAFGERDRRVLAFMQ
jgi:hypothetical protein